MITAAVRNAVEHAQRDLTAGESKPLVERYLIAYKAARSVAGALVKARDNQRPRRKRRKGKATSVWAGLASLDKELRGLAAVLAVESTTAAGAEAGITRLVDMAGVLRVEAAARQLNAYVWASAAR